MQDGHSQVTMNEPGLSQPASVSGVDSATTLPCREDIADKMTPTASAREPFDLAPSITFSMGMPPIVDQPPATRTATHRQHAATASLVGGRSASSGLARPQQVART